MGVSRGAGVAGAGAGGEGAGAVGGRGSAFKGGDVIPLTESVLVVECGCVVRYRIYLGCSLLY